MVWYGISSFHGVKRGVFNMARGPRGWNIYHSSRTCADVKHLIWEHNLIHQVISGIKSSPHLRSLSAIPKFAKKTWELETWHCIEFWNVQTVQTEFCCDLLESHTLNPGFVLESELQKVLYFILRRLRQTQGKTAWDKPKAKLSQADHVSIAFQHQLLCWLLPCQPPGLNCLVLFILKVLDAKFIDPKRIDGWPRIDDGRIWWPEITNEASNLVMFSTKSGFSNVAPYPIQTHLNQLRWTGLLLQIEVRRRVFPQGDYLTHLTNLPKHHICEVVGLLCHSHKKALQPFRMLLRPHLPRLVGPRQHGQHGKGTASTASWFETH